MYFILIHIILDEVCIWVIVNNAHPGIKVGSFNCRPHSLLHSQKLASMATMSMYSHL